MKPLTTVILGAILCDLFIGAPPHGIFMFISGAVAYYIAAKFIWQTEFK